MKSYTATSLSAVDSVPSNSISTGANCDKNVVDDRRPSIAERESECVLVGGATDPTIAIDPDSRHRTMGGHDG
jgi:hypothetical protein